MNKTTKGVLLTLIGGIFWGFCGFCGEYLFKTKGFDSNWVSCVRLFSSGLILVLLSLAKNKTSVFNIFKNKKSALTLIAFGIFGLMTSQFTYLTTIRYSNSGTATVLQYTGLAMILIVVCIKELRLPRLLEFLAVLLALGGTCLIATHGDFNTMFISKECLFWGLASGVGLVCYSLIPGNIIKEYGAITVSGYGMLIGGIVLSLFLRPWEYSVSIDLLALLALGGVIIIGTVIAYNFYLIGVSLIGPIKAGMIASIEPVAAALFSAFWIGTSFTYIDIIGFIMIISTVFIINIKKSKS